MWVWLKSKRMTSTCEGGLSQLSPPAAAAKVPPDAVPWNLAPAFQSAFWAVVGVWGGKKGTLHGWKLIHLQRCSVGSRPPGIRETWPCFYLPEVLFRNMVAIRSFHGSWKSVSWIKLKGERGGVHFRKAFLLGGLGAARVQDHKVQNELLIIACKYSTVIHL